MFRTGSLRFQSLNLDKLDVLIVGCHGHGSLTGFYIADEPVRWHELASALKKQLTCFLLIYLLLV